MTSRFATSRTVSIAVLAGSLLVGCAGPPDTGPPTVHYGQDVCAACNMIVSEERFASAVVTRTERDVQPLVFDDVGCLFEWEKRAEGADVVTHWVQSHSGSGWIAAASGWYVRSAEIRSPMGSGVAAYATRSEAEEMADSRSGEVLDWSRLRAVAQGEGLLAAPPRAHDG